MIFLKISKYLVLEIKIYKLSGFRLSNQNVQCKLILYLTTLNTFKRGHMVNHLFIEKQILCKIPF